MPIIFLSAEDEFEEFCRCTLGRIRDDYIDATSNDDWLEFSINRKYRGFLVAFMRYVGCRHNMCSETRQQALSIVRRVRKMMTDAFLDALGEEYIEEWVDSELDAQMQSVI